MAAELDLSPLKKAVDRLREGLERYERNTEDIQIRDGLIQRFEVTYEQSHKMLRRYLRMTSGSPDEYADADFQFVIRSGNERGLLLGEWADWKKYRELRAKASHTYDEDIAREVAGSIPVFLREAEALLERLQAKLHS